MSTPEQDQETTDAFLATRTEEETTYHTSSLDAKERILLEKLTSGNSLWKLWAIHKVFSQDAKDFPQATLFDIIGATKDCLSKDPNLWNSELFGVITSRTHLLQYFWKDVDYTWQKSFDLASVSQVYPSSDQALLGIWRGFLLTPKSKKEELRYFIQSKIASPVLHYFVSMIASLYTPNLEDFADVFDVMLQENVVKLWAEHHHADHNVFLVSQKVIPFGGFESWKSFSPIVGLQEQKETKQAFDLCVALIEMLLDSYPNMLVTPLVLDLVEDAKKRNLIKPPAQIKDHLLDGLLGMSHLSSSPLFWQEVPRAICQAMISPEEKKAQAFSPFVYSFGLFVLKDHVFWKDRLQRFVDNKKSTHPKHMDEFFFTLLDTVSLSKSDAQQENLIVALALTEMVAFQWHNRTILDKNDDILQELEAQATDNDFASVIFELTGMPEKLFFRLVYHPEKLVDGTTVLSLFPPTLLKVLKWEDVDIKEFEKRWAQRICEVEGYLSLLVDQATPAPKTEGDTSLVSWLKGYQVTVIEALDDFDDDDQEKTTPPPSQEDPSFSSVRTEEKEELPQWNVVTDQDKLQSALKKWKSNKEGDHNYLVEAYNEKRFAPRPLQVVKSLSVFDELDKMFPQFHEAIHHYRVFAILQSQGNKSFYAPPLLLDGPPGIGKTYFALQLSKALQVAFFPLSIPNIAGSFEMVGSSSQWQGGRGGFILDTWLESPFANPLVLFDEIDKVNQSNFAVGPTLLNLLESHTAQHFTDQFAQVPLDIRPFVYLATSNRCQAMPDPLISRFHVIKMGLPTFSDRVALVNGVYQKSLKEYSWGQHMKDLPQESVQFLAQTSGSARDLNSRIMRAIAKAIQHNRVEVIPSDIEGVVLSKKPWDLPLEECQKLFESNKLSSQPSLTHHSMEHNS